MAKDTIVFKADLSQYRGLVNAMSKMDKNANGILKSEVRKISAWTVGEMQAASAAAPMPKQAAVVARSIRPVADRIPSVAVGGARGRTAGGAVSGNLLMGSEFGGPTWFKNGGRRFPYRSPRQGRGNRGYFIFPTLKRLQPEITRRWKHTVEQHVIGAWRG